MSANAPRLDAVPALPRRQGEPQAAPRRIQVVPGRQAARRVKAWPYLLLAAALAILMIAVPMVVNTQMAQRAYEIRDQQVVLAELKAETETLESELLAAQSPQALEEKATALGLVPAGEVGAISLERRSVEGGVPAQ